MVIPRSRSSGALSIWSYARNCAPPDLASTLVMAAVSVVFPWSTWPMVPTFTWGLVRSNFAFAITPSKSAWCLPQLRGAWFALEVRGAWYVVASRARRGSLVERWQPLTTHDAPFITHLA